MLSTYCDAMLLRGDLRHCVTMHPSGCFSRREADRQNQKALRNLSVAFTKDGINYFTLGKELAQAGPKAVDLTFSYNMTTGGVSHAERSPAIAMQPLIATQRADAMPLHTTAVFHLYQIPL